MANLIELPEWVEGIYQLEEDDEVLGGPDGIDNRQAKQLANRTSFLKKEMEKRAPSASPVFTGVPTAPTAAASNASGQLATTQFVANAIAALVGSAPETLDTLAEIANALGSDSKLKETLLAELAKKVNKTDFTQAFSKNGWVKLPNGLILQWGQYNQSSTEGYMGAFPIAFPNNCLQVYATDRSNAGNGGTLIYVTNSTKTHFSVETNKGEFVGLFIVFAIGY